MITTVSTWRCKCGVRVNVVSQTPKTEPGTTQEAACPKCGDRQQIDGKTIISVTMEEDARVQET